jgi:triosephosphate isomerase (TIM)
VTTGARTPLVVGNWKLHNNLAASEALARAVAKGTEGVAGVEVAVAPVFVSLPTVAKVLAGSHVKIAAQDVHWEDKGAFTGEVSAPLLADVGCRFCIVGHSERRQLFGETDALVKKKVGALLRAGLTPIVCVGETLAQREAGDAERTVLGQIDAIFDAGDGATLARVVVAYEPVWAIGTGKVATPEDAQLIHGAIRRRCIERIDAGAGAGLILLYGGSVKPDNAGDLMAEPDIDGALVGGASLEAAGFAAIVRAASVP